MESKTCKFDLLIFGIMLFSTVGAVSAPGENVTQLNKLEILFVIRLWVMP